MIIEVRLEVISKDRKHLETLKRYAPPEGEDRELTLIHATELLWTYLDTEYPGQTEHVGDGRFHWVRPYGFAGDIIPGTVKYTDPEENAAYEAQRSKEIAEETERQKRVLAHLDTLPAMRIAEGQERIWANAQKGNLPLAQYAERWARLMQEQIDAHLPGKLTYSEKEYRVAETIGRVAESTHSQADFLGASGAWRAVCVHMLSCCWVYGLALRRWHNRQFDVQDDTSTVNPAVLTIHR